MKSIVLIYVVALLAFQSRADQYSDLEKYAKEVPSAEIDREVLSYIKNETNEEVSGLKSHYTLALFENLKTGKKWYILDGYYELSTGKILFLDFTYKPDTKVWWPVENYRRYIPASVDRFLLWAEERCNPYKRNFIGLVRVQKDDSVSIDSLTSFLGREFDQPPALLVSPHEILVIDYTRDGLWGESPTPQFTLIETSLVQKLDKELKIRSEIVPSGREQSNGVVKKTYVAVTESCRKN